MKKLTIFTCSYWTDDWVALLLKTLKERTSNEFEFINRQNHLKKVNLGHGASLDWAVKNCETEYLAIFDSDAHVLLQDWDKILIDKFETDSFLKLAIASDGGLLKPARPLAMFMRVKDIKDNNISFMPNEVDGAKFDVSVHAYFKVLTLFGDKSVLRLPYKKTEYDNVLGNEYMLDGKRFVYHNWYSSRWFDKTGFRCKSVVDSIKWVDFEAKKKNLFNQVK